MCDGLVFIQSLGWVTPSLPHIVVFPFCLYTSLKVDCCFSTTPRVLPCPCPTRLHFWPCAPPPPCFGDWGLTLGVQSKSGNPVHPNISCCLEVLLLSQQLPPHPPCSAGGHSFLWGLFPSLNTQILRGHWLKLQSPFSDAPLQRGLTLARDPG